MRAVSDLLTTVQHATVATVSEEGRPWNTPVYFAWHGQTFYWTSRIDAQHSQNVRHNPQAFIVVYDSGREDSTSAALYIEAEVTELTDEAAVEFASAVIYRRREKPVPSVDEFRDPSPHRVYGATALRAWTNILHVSDTISWDERIEIPLAVFGR